VAECGGLLISQSTENKLVRACNDPLKPRANRGLPLQYGTFHGIDVG
jgi:hypothetical protein